MMPVPANESESQHQNGEIENSTAEFKSRYRELKRKLQSLLYEQEGYQDELQKAQRKLLKVNRDKSFLLDRLLQYEPVEISSSDDERTASSSDEEQESQQNYWSKTSTIVKPPSETKTKKKASAVASTSNMQSKINSKTNKKQATETCEKTRCKTVENGKQCSKLVSKRIKSGLCFTHRSMLKAEKQARQPKEGLDRDEKAPSHLPPHDAYFNPPNPMISGGIPDDLRPHGSLSDQVYRMAGDLSSSAQPDSPEPADFQTNLYEGDDDLVIDLPE